MKNIDQWIKEKERKCLSNCKRLSNGNGMTGLFSEVKKVGIGLVLSLVSWISLSYRRTAPGISTMKINDKSLGIRKRKGKT